MDKLLVYGKIGLCTASLGFVWSYVYEPLRDAGLIPANFRRIAEPMTSDRMTTFWHNLLLGMGGAWIADMLRSVRMEPGPMLDNIF